MSEPRPPRRALHELDEQAIWAAILVCGAALFVLWRLASRHTAPLLALLVVAAGVAAVALRARALIADRAARRLDPPGPGVVVGQTRGTWLGARPRPFFLAWLCFTRHVLIVGPTGRGKTMSFIDPILRAHVARPGASVFYLDGKGTRVDLDDPRTGARGVPFDHVFCPEDPAASARWNPLAGADPVRAAARFAAALYPEATQADQYYAQSAAFVIATVAPAIAYTGHGIDGISRVRPHAELVAELVARRIDPALADGLARNGDETERQLRWLPLREHQNPDALVELIRRKAGPSASWPETEHWPPSLEVTIADLNRLLFTGDLGALRDAIDTLLPDVTHRARRATLEQLRTDLGALAAMSDRERGAILSGLRNRLGWFLKPPFLELCSRSDFDIAEVTSGKSIGFLLPTGSFPDVAVPLGRVALAQFTQAVLSSTPQRTKLAVLDEFHSFVDEHFAAFLNQARSYGGGAVMAFQTIASIPREHRDELLANPSTVIVTPGCMPFDADHFSKVFGETQVEQRSRTYETGVSAVGPRRGSVRIDVREQPRYTPTQITELEPLHAIVVLEDGTCRYGPTIVDVRHQRP